MLEEKTYTKAELSAYFGTDNSEGLCRKMRNYGITFTQNGRGNNSTFTITGIGDPFKVYCVFDLGMSYRTNFTKFRDFLFYLLGDEDFSWRPQEMMEAYLRDHGHTLSRKTIGNYLDKLESLNLVSTKGEVVYYRVYRDTQGEQCHELVSKQEYSQAWKVYWARREAGYDSRIAFVAMYRHFHGVPRKQCKVVQNGIYHEELNLLSQLVAESFLNESEAK